jgi:hypothetical protein
MGYTLPVRQPFLLIIVFHALLWYPNPTMWYHSLIMFPLGPALEAIGPRTDRIHRRYTTLLIGDLGGGIVEPNAGWARPTLLHSTFCLLHALQRSKDQSRSAPVVLEVVSVSTEKPYLRS